MWFCLFTEAGREWLANTWKLCNPITSDKDVDNLKNWLVDVYGNLAMVDYPYPASFLEPLPAYPIQVITWYIVLLTGIQNCICMIYSQQFKSHLSRGYIFSHTKF